MATIQSASDLKAAIDNQDSLIELASGLDIQMGAYEDLSVASGTTIRPVSGFTTRPVIRYDAFFADNTFKGLFRFNSNVTLEDTDLIGLHARDADPRAVQNAVRILDTGCTFSRVGFRDWCKWAVDIEENEAHLFDRCSFSDVYWDADDGAGYLFGGYGYAIWSRGRTGSVPAYASQSRVTRCVFNDCRNGIDSGSQANKAMRIDNNFFGSFSQSAIDSHSGGWDSITIHNNVFGPSLQNVSIRIFDIIEDARISGNIFVNKSTVAVYFDPAANMDDYWDVSVVDLIYPDPIVRSDVGSGSNADIDMRENWFRQ